MFKMTSKSLNRAAFCIHTCRTFSTSSNLSGRKNLVQLKWLKRDTHPYDERFHISPREVAKSFKSPKGNNELARQIARQSLFAPNIPGHIVGRKFYYVPEMQPEFIVPNLTDFKLKPYVSYNAPEVTQSEFTAKDLFDAVYAKDVVDKYQDGKIKADQLTVDKIINSDKAKR